MPTSVSTYSPNYTHAENGTPLLWLCTACAVAVSCCDYSSDNSPASEDVEALGLVTFYESGWDDQEESFRCDCCDQDAYCVPTLFAPAEEIPTIKGATESMEETSTAGPSVSGIESVTRPLLRTTRKSYEISKDALTQALKDGSLQSVAYHYRALASQADDLSALEGYLESERRIGTERTLERLELHAARDEEDSPLVDIILTARETWRV